MVILNWLDTLLRKSSGRRRPRRKDVKRRPFQSSSSIIYHDIQRLEDRTLLSAAMLFQAIDATPLTLQVAETELQVVDTNSPETVLASAVLSELTAGVTIAGNGYDVDLTIDVSVPAVSGGILFAAGTGTNRLFGPGGDQTWNVTGDGAGDIGGGIVEFKES